MTDSTSEPVGSLAAALAQTRRMLGARPALAEEQAREILKVAPGHPEAELLLAMARAGQGDDRDAIAILEPLAKSQPKAPAVHFELGLALSRAGEADAAVKALRRTVRLRSNHAEAWRALGDALTLLGDATAADDAYAHHIKASVNDPRLLEAAAALIDNKLAVAEHSLRAFLKQHPTDIAALRMLAEVGARLGRMDDAEKLLTRALELAPSFDAARHNRAILLHRQNKTVGALADVDLLLANEPRNPNYLSLKAAALARLGEQREAEQIYERLLKDVPSAPKIWMSYGHTLKTLGKQDPSIAAYRKSIALMPQLGEAWWSLANLKTVRFAADDVAAMRAQLKRKDLSDEDRFHLHFALGKALEDAGDYAASFEHYEKGNALRREALPYRGDDMAAFVDRTIALYTPEFLAARAGAGSAAPDPIFIIGLPRSGSTLIEQILSSHSQVEGTTELHDITDMARGLGWWTKKDESETYPEVLASLPAGRFAQLGEDYLERTRPQRKTSRPFFIDKMPNNFLHTGFIHLMLPRAKIIDARRHPMDCCFSNFKQHFARGQSFTYDLADLGRYYAGYVALMAHFDRVLPGRVHRVFYENMVADPEHETRALLDCCGLAFEDSCLRFYESDRLVRTASSEQVRQPIYTSAVGHWRHFEPWLDPLKAALGAVLAGYPAVPKT